MPRTTFLSVMDLDKTLVPDSLTDLDKTFIPSSILELDKTFVPYSNEGFEDEDDGPSQFLPGDRDIRIIRRNWWEGPTVNTATEVEEEYNIDNHDECDHHMDDHENQTVEITPLDYDQNSTWIKGTISAPLHPSEKRKPSEHLYHEAKRPRPGVKMNKAENRHHGQHRCKKIQNPTCELHPKKLTFSSANSRSSSASSSCATTPMSVDSQLTLDKIGPSSGVIHLLQGYGRQLCPGPQYTEKRCQLALLGLRTLVTEREVTMEDVVASGVFPSITTVLMRRTGDHVKKGGLQTVLACWGKSKDTTKALIVEELGDFVVEGLAARGGELGALAVQLIANINEFFNKA